jgi:predicted transcriptional regulator
MTGQDLRKMLERVGMSQRRLARDLEMGDREIRRWCAGDVPLRRVHEYAIRYLLESQSLR